jgi:hypothetical protein
MALLFFVEPAGLGPISAILHITPATAFIATDIQKQPAAGRIGTRFDIVQLIGYQQLGSGTDNWIENPVQP